MPVRNVYLTGGEGVLRNFDFFDFASGIAFKRFYPVDLITGAGVAALSVVTNTVYGVNGRATAVNAAIDNDYDTQFIQPLTVKGIATANISVAIRRVSGGSTTVSSGIIVDVIHYDGTTETSLGSAEDFVSATLNDGENAKKIFAFKIPLTTKTIKPTDTLRINIKASSPGTTRQVYILTDPNNRTDIPFGSGDPVVTSTSTIDIPFKGDI